MSPEGMCDCDHPAGSIHGVCNRCHGQLHRPRPTSGTAVHERMRAPRCHYPDRARFGTVVKSENRKFH